MKQGFDASQDLTQFAAGLVSAGYSFVGRYYNINNPSKNLTLAEAKALSAAGIAIIAVWENGYPTEASYFSHDVGVYDGTSAYYYAHKTIGQPSGNPIYFAVDYDASTADLASGIIPYFQGIADGFNAISSNSPVYPVGIYGSGLVCQALLGQNLATYAWLAQSSGWQDSSSFTGCRIWKFTHLYFITRCFGSFFSISHRSDFGLAIRTSWHVIIIKRFRILACHLFHTCNTLSTCYVCQCLPAHTIANGMNARNIGLVISIHYYFSFFGNYT